MQEYVKTAFVVVIVGFIIAGFVGATYPQATKTVYATQVQNVTLDNGQVVTTPSQLVPPSLALQIYGIAPWLILVGVAMISGFILWKGGKHGM